MPKMKTNSGAKKRFKLKSNGSIKRGSAFRSHILTKKSQKRKVALRGPQTIDSTNKKSVKIMLSVS